MAQSFDVVVIGTGAAGATVAHKCRAAGWQVAIIDSRPYGGTCALRGCDPKKVLVGVAEVVDWQRRMQGYGAVAAEVRIAWPELMRFKRTFTAPVPEQNEQSFTQAGIVTFHGRAHFLDQTTLQVGEEQLESRFVVIANGAQPRDLGIPGAELVTTSEQFLELDALPEHLIFIGGGYISFEFAHIAARAGADVTILHRGARPLEQFDPDLVDRLVAASRDLGIEVRLNTEVTAVAQADGELHVHVRNGAAQEQLTTSLVVHGAGRVPEIDDLELERAGIARTAKGVTVNRYLQSVSNPAVYAAGDAADTAGLKLTPVATSEGHVVASNLIRENHREPVYTGTPSVVFTIPALAAVGMREDEARRQGLAVKVTTGDTSGWYSARRTRERPTGYKVLVEEGNGRILGAHLLGSHAEEVINLFALAIRHELRAADLKQMIYAYPTSALDISYML